MCVQVACMEMILGDRIGGIAMYTLFQQWFADLATYLAHALEKLREFSEELLIVRI